MTQPTLDLRQRLTARPRTSGYELVVDNFAGAGGASLGIEAGLGRPVDVAINHNPLAIEIHTANHPNTFHYTQDIWEVDPVEVCKGRPVGLAWFSPDCKHFSKAKGGKPVSKRIRSLAWVVVKWAKLVKPRVIILENVEEFRDWGPLGPDDKPIASRKGETFRRWLGMLKRAGYAVEHRSLVAADYGTPTIRKRFFLIARCDGQPIVWPAQTHWKAKEANGRPTWRPAADCIDWSLPCPSIFTRKRPLVNATQRRIALGLKKFVFENPKPFLVMCNHQGNGFRGRSISEPMDTITGSRDARGLVMPFLSRYFTGPDSKASDPRDPLPTVTAIDHNALVAPHVIRTDMHLSNSGCVYPVDEPLRTMTTSGGFGIMAPTLVQTGYGERKGQKPRALDIGQPLGTLVGTGKHALVAAWLSKFYGTAIGSDARDPMPTVGAQGFHFAEVRAFLLKYYGSGGGQDLRDPMATVTARHRLGLVTAYGYEFLLGDIGLRMLTPDELKRGQMGRFASEYVLIGTQKDQVAAIGNSVCPELAEALVKANVVIQRVAA